MTVPASSSLAEFYAAQIQPALSELESERKQTIRRGVIAGLSIGTATLLLGTLATMVIPSFWVVLVLVILAVIAWYWAVSGPYGRFRSAFKHKVMGAVVGYIGEGLQYDPEGSISESEFVACKIFSRQPDRYNGEDLVVGKHGATTLRFSEVHAEYKTESTDSKGNRSTSWHDIFKGILFVADFNKHFNGLTVVAPDVAERFMGFFGKTLQSWGSVFEGRGTLITLDNPEFEQAFKVMTSDEVEARYILSPSMMQRILEFKGRTGKDISLSFYAEQIYVAVPSRENQFEAPSILRPIPESISVEQVERYFSDLNLVLSIVDELDLNTRIWSKGASVAS